jgi:Tol biopolymer transport system component
LPRLPDQVEFAGAASWSPDGKRLAYTCTTFSIPLRPNYVCVARPDRRGFRRLARGSSPTWSVSGEIAFAHRATGTLGQSLIYVIGRSGRSTRLTDGNVADSAPSWSPDGRRLAFARSDLRAGRETIVTLGRHARTPRMLVPSLPLDNVVGGPIWSPDGRWIAYSTFVGIYEVPAGGGQPRELLSASTFRFPGGNSVRLTPTDWQPLP